MATPMVQVNVRVEPDLYQEVKRIVGRDKLTMSAVVQAALRDYVKGNK